MNTLSRKQREIRDRELLFLDIAEQLLDAHGHQALSMDRIAEIAEYSKGTVYQHFKNKEEVLIHICWRGMGLLAELFERAASFDGNGRERMLAILTAHRLYAALYPLHFDMINTVKAGGVKEKIGCDCLEKHQAAEQRVLGAVAGVVLQAQAEGELPASCELSPMELVYGLWSLTFGGLSLQNADVNLAEIGVRDPNHVLATIGNYTLDGAGWTPLSRDFDYHASLTRIRDSLFAAEFAQLAARNGDQPTPPSED
jgi:AcrR family transcriptional regulator